MLQNIVTLEPESHRYFNQVTGKEYLSISKVLSMIEQPFDPDGFILAATAKKRGISPEELKKEWKQKGKNSTDHGTFIHNELESYDKTTVCNEMIMPLAKDILSVLTKEIEYDKILFEEVLFSDYFGIAGTSDRVLRRKKKVNGKWIIDIFDYKTNISKGIEYYSKYRKYLKSPLNYVEQCNFTRYALQLSGYGYLAEEMLPDCIVGRLGIIFIPPDDFMKWQLIPVPYQKYEINELFRFVNNSVQINTVETESDEFRN